MCPFCLLPLALMAIGAGGLGTALAAARNLTRKELPQLQPTKPIMIPNRVTAEELARHAVVSPEEWRAKRIELLEKEKAFTKHRDEVNAARRELPWVKVTKEYVFEGPDGPQTLAQLFDGRSQLLTYHFMFGPDWEAGCPGCSLFGDHVAGPLYHLPHRDVSLVMISRAPIAKIEAYRKRMGWEVKWLSSGQNDFNFDYHVSASPADQQSGQMEYNYRTEKLEEEELPGISAFYKNEAGEIFHTYSSYARGFEFSVGIFHLLDITPKGRDEDGSPLTWLKRHDEYAGASPVKSCCGS